MRCVCEREDIMREIKFRAKRIDNGEWVFGSYAPTRPKDLKSITRHLIFDGYIWYEINPETLGQYTGRKDKNGVEIYEDDATNYGVVKWFDNLAWDMGGSIHPGFYFDEAIYDHDDFTTELSYHKGFKNDIEII